MTLLTEPVQSLRGLGYTARESEFLYFVATHSGFFVQRQFAAYIDISGRGPVTDFVKKALQKNHAREHPAEHGSQKVYHLFSRSLYASIGKENSRNRKTGRYGLLDKPAVRMLSLDFVLAHSTEHYLEEETDKIEYFTKQKQISLEMLPSRTFAGANGSMTRRYFVERFPIFLTETATASVLNFTYIEDQLHSLHTFSSFLERYRSLFEACPGQSKLIFASNSAQSFRLAEQRFDEMFSAPGPGNKINDLATHFRLRKMAEEKRFRELTHADVINWQRGLRRYSGPEYENQYQGWKENGKLPELDHQESGDHRRPQFETCLLSPERVRRGLSVVTQSACTDAPPAATEPRSQGA